VSVMNARGCGRLGRCGLYQYGCAWMWMTVWLWVWYVNVEQDDI
jgi:hypothetical protein